VSDAGKSFVYTNIHSGLRPVFPEVETYCPIDHLFFGFRNSLGMKQVLGPGWHHYLDMEVVGSGRIRKQLPAVSPISQMNQPKLVHETVELAPSSFVQLEVDCDEHRPIPSVAERK